MGRTLLVGARTGVWREWLKENRQGREVLILDPADADYGVPGRLAHFQGEKSVRWCFVGSLSTQRAPHVLLRALFQLLSETSVDAIVELFPYRPSPLRLQLTRICAEAVRPETVLVDQRCHFEKKGFEGLVEEIELPEGPPDAVLGGHRKARWLQMIEQCEPHEIDLRRVAVDGLRFGSGVPIPVENLRKCGFAEPLHGEVAGNSLLVVSEAEVEDVEVSRALDSVHASKAHIVASKSYENLLCSFARLDGEDFAMGRIDRIDFHEMVAQVSATAVAPAAVATLRVGGLRVDAEGRELGELKPWEA